VSTVDGRWSALTQERARSHALHADAMHTQVRLTDNKLRNAAVPATEDGVVAHPRPSPSTQTAPARQFQAPSRRSARVVQSEGGGGWRTKWARQRRLTTSTASRWRTGNSSVRIIGKGHTGQEHGHAPTTLTVRRLATELSTLNARRRPCRVTSLHNAHHNTHSHLDTTAFAAELCEPAHTLTDRARRTSNPHASRTIHSDDVHSGPRRTTESAGDSGHKPEKQARRDQPPGNTPTQS
jgi:hypothetical protein